jgi:zinc transporter, ZIP family|nr:hypothetical protein [Nitrosomonas nitrosa]
MTSTIFSVLTYALIPAVTITLGGALATLRAPGPKIRSGVQHFAAGLVFAAVAVRESQGAARDVGDRCAD